MEKITSLNNAVKTAMAVIEYLKAMHPKKRVERFRAFRRQDFGSLVKHVGKLATETICESDSAGDSVFMRVGDFHCVSYWTGEDMVFIYEALRGTNSNQHNSLEEDLERILESNPIFEQQL
jgi:hypothetical protein